MAIEFEDETALKQTFVLLQTAYNSSNNREVHRRT